MIAVSVVKDGFPAKGGRWPPVGGCAGPPLSSPIRAMAACTLTGSTKPNIASWTRGRVGMLFATRAPPFVHSVLPACSGVKSPDPGGSDPTTAAGKGRAPRSTTTPTFLMPSGSSGHWERHTENTRRLGGRPPQHRAGEDLAGPFAKQDRRIPIENADVQVPSGAAPREVSRIFPRGRSGTTRASIQMQRAVRVSKVPKPMMSIRKKGGTDKLPGACREGLEKRLARRQSATGGFGVLMGNNAWQIGGRGSEIPPTDLLWRVVRWNGLA